MNFSEPGRLGKTKLCVGRLGIASGYGAPAAAYEEAFERGCNYFYWTSRRAGMREAIQHICGRGKRDRLIVAIQSYSRSATLMEIFAKKALKSLGLNEVDVFLLGWHQKQPSPRLIDKALQMKKKGYFRLLGMTGHNRSLFPEMAKLEIFDIFHIRYNAAHRGAEAEAFPFLNGDNGPGIVTYTATRWGELLNPKKMPDGERPLSAADCYRFVLSNPAVDVCLCGPKNITQMREALETLNAGPLEAPELEHIKRIGDTVHAKTMKFW